jgi:LacI family transcriptional regulator
MICKPNEICAPTVTVASHVGSGSVNLPSFSLLKHRENSTLSTKRPRVALIIESANSNYRGLLRGINGYIREHKPWSISIMELGRDTLMLKRALKDLQKDGIIAHIENYKIAAEIAKAQLPLVSVGSALEVPDVPVLETDNFVIATMAIEHFRDRGFSQLAFCGDSRYKSSDRRQSQFVQACSEAGCPCFEFPREQSERYVSSSLQREEGELLAWIRQLPKPMGVLACNDLRGMQILDICSREGIAVPEEVAVLGVDNDELLCELSEPPLSSIVTDACRMGYLAAQMLNQLMTRRACQQKIIAIPPLRIASRQSTDAIAVADDDVSMALRFIREHACDGITVEDILKAVPLTRRALEIRFKKYFGRTPHDEILRVKLNTALQLLLETSLSLANIAEQTGFPHPEYFSVAFKQHFGMPPSAYRQKAGRDIS